MNKIILLSEKEELAKGLMDFACMLNNQSQILLTGVFLPKDDYWDTLLYYSLGPSSPYLYREEEVPVMNANHAIAEFKRICEHNDIEYRVHEASYIDLKKDLKKETRFADLMLLAHSSFHYNYNEAVNDVYTTEAMHYTECPVVIVPEKSVAVEHNILLYDGSASSVYAIRQYAAIFPQLAQLDTLLVYVNPNEENGFPDKDYIEELAARHYPNLTFYRLDINPKKYFTTWLADRKNTLLVTGAKGRNGVSELLRSSFIGEALSDQHLPIFIAHR